MKVFISLVLFAIIALSLEVWITKDRIQTIKTDKTDLRCSLYSFHSKQVFYLKSGEYTLKGSEVLFKDRLFRISDCEVIR